MMKNYLKQSGYLVPLRLESVISKKTAGFFLTFLTVLTFLFFAFFFFSGQALWFNAIKLAIALIFIFWVYWLFLSDQEKNRIDDELQNTLEKKEYGKFFSFAVARYLSVSVVENKFYPYKLFRYLLKQPEFFWILTRLDIPTDKIVAANNRYFPKIVFDLEEMLELMLGFMAKAGREKFGLEDIFRALYKLDGNFRKFLFDCEIKIDELVDVCAWRRRYKEKLKRQYKFWPLKRLLEVKGVGKDWSAGFTPNLDSVTRDITKEAEIYGTPQHMYGHRQYVAMIEKILVQNVHNAVVVGLPGIGRHTVIRALAAAINWGRTYGPLRYTRLLQMDSSAILSHTRTSTEALDRIRLLFNEAYWAGNVILVINDIDAFFENKDEIGRVDATEALLPFLKSKLRIIGLTSPRGFQSTIGKHPELMRLFGKVVVREPSKEETLVILQDESIEDESRTGVLVTYQALKEIVELSVRLIQNLPNPEKSLEVLDEVMVYVSSSTSDRKVFVSHVQKIISDRTQIPVEKITGLEKRLLLNLEEYLHQRIVGQEEPIKQISSALRRARSGIQSEKRPIGSFLFLGPTGVGKTETAKALASVYFGSEEKIIRFDMSEFQEVHSINRLIGDADAKEGGLLTEAVIALPFSVILLDEIEKAHPKILDLFLQVLDEARLTDAMGRTVSFVNCMIIATSNAGADLIRESVKAGKTKEIKESLLDYLQRKHIFRPEFLNRFDGLVVFNPLTEEELGQVASLILAELNNRLKEKEVSVKITPMLVSFIVKHAYVPEFGARPLRRFIQEHIENYIATGLISGQIRRGQEIELTKELLDSM